MRSRAPRTYDELTAAPPWPLSRLYHENSKLTGRRAMELREQIERFSGGDGAAPAGPKTYSSRPAIELPRAGRRFLGARLDDALRARRSQRGPFAEGAIKLASLGALLDLALGVTGEAGLAKGGSDAESVLRLRAFPSAGGLYPVEAYVAALACQSVERGIYHYHAARHALARVAPCPAPAELARMIFAEELWEGAAAAVIFTGVFARTQEKYGERGYRFVLLEAGHAAQNVLLAAEVLRLSAAPIGGFCEDALGEAMGLDGAMESAVYVVLLGERKGR